MVEHLEYKRRKEGEGELYTRLSVDEGKSEEMLESLLPKLFILSTIKLQFPSHNTERGGTRVKFQKAKVVIDGELYTVNVITGNALRNWLARLTLREYVARNGVSVHKQHFIDMYRISGKLARECGISDKTPREEAERIVVSGCAICDLFGFLLKERGLPEVGRKSVIYVSFLIPTRASIIRNIRQAITHNERLTIYAFKSLIDLGGIGRSQYVKKEGVWLGKELISKDEAQLRLEACLRAYLDLLTHPLGASLVRTLPPIKVKTLAVLLTKNLIPAPLHPFYDDYIESLKEIVEFYKDDIVNVYLLNIDIGTDEKVKTYNKLHDLFKDVIADSKDILELLWS